MTALLTARVVPGRGMVGDRYYLRRGRDEVYDQLTCDVTLVEQETIEAMKPREPAIDPGESAQRNIVVRGCELSQLAGHTFRIGSATLRGLAPCTRPDASLENAQQNPSQEDTEQALQEPWPINSRLNQLARLLHFAQKNDDETHTSISTLIAWFIDHLAREHANHHRRGSGALENREAAAL